MLVHLRDISSQTSVSAASLRQELQNNFEGSQPEWCIFTIYIMLEIHHSGREPSIVVVCWLLYCPSNMLVYLRNGSTQPVVLAASLIIIIIINLIYIAQFDTSGILTALYIVITYTQMQYVLV